MPSARVLISRFAGRRRKKIGLDGAGHLDDERLAAAVERLARRRPDPTLAHGIFLDVAPLDAAKAHADATRKRRFVIERTRGVDAEPVGRNVGHRGISNLKMRFRRAVQTASALAGLLWREIFG